MPKVVMMPRALLTSLTITLSKETKNPIPRIITKRGIIAKGIKMMVHLGTKPTHKKMMISRGMRIRNSKTVCPSDESKRTSRGKFIFFSIEPADIRLLAEFLRPLEKKSQTVCPRNKNAG